jgi:hypothetical protein
MVIELANSREVLDQVIDAASEHCARVPALQEDRDGSHTLRCREE